MNIDEIYDLLTWDASLSARENEEREKRGITEASKLKNIYPFVQPILANAKQGGKSSKSAWESCAKVVAMKTDEELEPYLFRLFQWLQDMNWPGADIIFDRLLQIPFVKLESVFISCCKFAEKSKDEVWFGELCEFKKQHQSKQKDVK